MANKNTALSDEQIIAAILTGGTFTEAAKALNVSTRTLYDRMATKDFKTLYAGAKTDIIRGAVLKINHKLTEAIDTVSEIMNDKEVNAAVRLQAAQTLISNATKFSERLQHEELNNINNNIIGLFDFEFTSQKAE